MKTLITILMFVFAINCNSQNAETAKPFLKKADSLYSINNYSKAYDSYNISYRYDRVQSTRSKIDSCIKYTSIQQKELDRVSSINQTIVQLKMKKTELIFDVNGNAISYKNEANEVKPIIELRGDTYNKVKVITKKDWEAYK